MFYVYIIECKNKRGKISYYIGYTNDAKRRLEEHLSGKGARYLRGKTILRMMIYQEYHTIKQAMNGEVEAKKLPARRKKLLVGIAFGSNLSSLQIPVHGLAKKYPFWSFNEETKEGHYAFSDEWIMKNLESEFSKMKHEGTFLSG